LEADAVSDELWLATMWPFVRQHLPPSPARIVELGCGPLGGFVPRMRAIGYDAIGVDPEAPAGPEYEQIEFEQHSPTEPADALVASVSLHHVADLDDVLGRINSMLKPGATLVIIEWAHERFDEPTARWCFDRLGATGHSWLQHHYERWQESGLGWDEYFASWIQDEHLHPGADIIRALETRFETQSVSEGPYLFADLDGVTNEDEQAAIDAGQIQPGCLRYVGQRRGDRRA
jgi:SAM-dependent methyltransferase